MDEVKPPCLSEGYRTTSYLSTSLGLFLNALAIVLILFRTTKELRVYSRVLLGNCVVDVLFIVVTFVVDLHISFRNGIVFYVVDGGLLREETLHTKFVLIVLYLFVLYLTIFVVAPPFIYRYFAVCRNHVFTQLQYMSLMLLEVCMALCIGASIYFACWPFVETTAMDVSTIESACIDHGQVPFFHVSETRSLSIGAVLLLCGAFSSLNYGAVIICSYKILTTLSGLMNTGRRESSLSKQLNRVLILQALTPFLVAVVPLLGGLTMLLCSMDNASVFMELVTTVESFVPVLNPTYTIFFVKAYRRSLISCVARSKVHVGTSMPYVANSLY